MAGEVIVEALTWDLTPAWSDPQACVEAVIEEIRDAWNSGADLVLLPEFAWMMLEPLVAAGDQPLRAVADWFWHSAQPRLAQALAAPDKAVVLGTCPFFDAASGRLMNRAPILRAGEWLHQDKLHLTPWEKAFSPGDSINLFQFRGLTVAVIICLDIEVPELSALLRGRNVDLILCPSATETVLGVERVDRCASARAVELGCHVTVSHLLGKSPSVLVDENIGRVAVYHPSQVPFAKNPRWQEGPIEGDGIHRLRFEIAPAALKRMRRRTGETNPSLLQVRKTSQYLPVTLR